MMMKKNVFTITFILSLCLAQLTHAGNVLRLSTTTSTENSGLLAVLNPIFEQQYQARVDVIAVGTGKALKLGENGDVDIVLVHAPAAELTFVEKGFGIERTAVMHNDFVLIGPAEDPATVTLASSAVEALRLIHQAQSPFISRGDDSGTHKKEKFLWQQAGINPAGPWYLAIGQGMGTTLTVADEKRAYTLSDRGTYLAFQNKITLPVLFEGDPLLYNPYHIMAVNPAKHPHVNIDLARRYIQFITSKAIQQKIANFKKQGHVLFYPDAIKP
jgi:tungstate transport system substrate-binding protein